jgi:hypothetical protein
VSGRWIASLLLAALCAPAGVSAGEPADPVESGPSTLRSSAIFAGGALTALVAHEGCHVAANYLLGNPPSLRSVQFLGAIPFFAISPDVTCAADGACSRRDGGRFPAGPRGLYAIQSAGLACQQWGSEAILSTEPRLSERDAPFRKGMLALNSGLALGYAIANLVRIEPFAGDLAGDDRLFFHGGRGAVAVAVLVPAALDGLRYFFPDWTWLPWTSRLSKGALVGLAFAL